VAHGALELNINYFRRPDKYKAAMENFFKKIKSAIELHFDFEKLKCILIASPGFTRDEFLSFLLKPIDENKLFINSKEKFVSVHSSSGYKERSIHHHRPCGALELLSRIDF